MRSKGQHITTSALNEEVKKRYIYNASIESLRFFLQERR
ncbi:unnamed protein product [Acanthoscelides obtectus]|uniref:Uncharacterized protein n=1 Tax=Acanthoscelides obtectus TaxID=200917 RepID=A0A9P0M554_ACAOB|nr:unnamed protein product [Acanthoscelides obtectus]CAK1663219.1 hypothetical protein AOBTE_LOCUS23558 [Acanthoscelides obtectus]